MARPRIYTPEEAHRRRMKQIERYNKNHKKQAYLYQKRSRARGFIKHDATKKDLVELQSLIKIRMQELNQKDGE